MKNKRIFAILIFATNFFCFGFEWSQQATESSDFRLFFARPYGNNFSTGIVFAERNNVCACENSSLLMTIRESDRIDQFDSALGNAIIAIDEDKIMSVYGNLDSVFLQDAMEKIVAGSPLGTSGNSAWQESESGSEFQLLDVKNKCALNPQMILPKIDMKQDILIHAIALKNSNGKIYEPYQTQSIPSGKYSVYFARPNETATFRTEISLNGEKIETILYDRLFQTDDNQTQLCVIGKSSHAFDEIYNQKGQQFLGTINFSRGKSVLQIVAFDINGKATIANCSLDVY